MIKKLVVSRNNLVKYYGRRIPRLDFRLRYDSCSWDDLYGSRLKTTEHLQIMLSDNLAVTFNSYEGNLQAYRVLRAFEGSQYDHLILPKDLIETIELPGTLELLPKVLDSMFPGRYWLRDRGSNRVDLYLLFPEIEIQNTPGGKHKIKNLVVKVYLSDDCSLYSASLSGVRASMTREELAVNYQHSHLSEANNDLSSFCTGGGSRFDTYLKACTTKSLTESEFALFLVQLEEYLKWESLEGKPHRMMSSIAAGSNSYPTQVDAISTVNRMTRYLLMKLTPELIQKTGSGYMVNPGLNQAKWLEFETMMVAAGCTGYDYSTERGQWVNIAINSSRTSLPQWWSTSEGKSVQAALKLSPSVISGDIAVEDKSIIKRVSPETFKQVIIKLLELLNKHTKVTNNEQSDVNRESESNHNTEAIQPSVMPAQPVSTE